MFVQLSLDLFTRFNDASANNSILTSLNHIKSSTHLLGELCRCLNNKSTPIQLYYIKFLIRLFRINFKNNNTQSISNSQISNSLFQTQFEIINSWLDDYNANTVHKLVIEYLYQYSSLLGLKQQQQSINSFSLFKGLIVLLNQTLKFISTYLTDGKLCDCLIDIINDKLKTPKGNFHDDIKSFRKLLLTILLITPKRQKSPRLQNTLKMEQHSRN